MRRWRWLVGLSALGALLLLAGSAWFAWDPWDLSRLFKDGRLAAPPFVHRFSAGQAEVPSGGLAVLQAAASFFTMYLVGVLVLFIFPRQVGYIDRHLGQAPGSLPRQAALGLLVIVVFAGIMVSAALTTSTFPLTVFLVSLLFLCTIFGLVAVAYAVGRRLLARAGWESLSPLVALLLGLVLVFALSELPLLGLLVKAALASLAVGVVVFTRFGTGRGWNLSPLREE